MAADSKSKKKQTTLYKAWSGSSGGDQEADDDDDDVLLLWAESQTVANNPSKANLPKLDPKKKPGGWVSSAFEDFDDFGQNVNCSQALSSQIDKKSRKRPRETSTSTNPKLKKKPIVSHDLWVDKHVPKTQAELAVHKKKIGEVQSWIEDRFALKQHKGGILLLTGPAGAGKTACIQVLSKEMRFEVQEWINPPSNPRMDIDSWKQQMSDFAPVGGLVSESQVTQFQDFLLRANRYPTLQIFSQDQLHRKVIFVEEYPNSFFKETHLFHGILRKFCQHGQCPLVFIISDSAGGDSNERLLFPKDVQADLGIFNISFNPVAPTVMVKVLQRIASLEASRENHGLSVPSKSTLENLAASTAGDIRGAINALQFACLKGEQDVDVVLGGRTKPNRKQSQKVSSRTSKCGKSQTLKKKPSSEDLGSEQAAIGGRDTSLFLFRALGKILYCKRGAREDFPEQLAVPVHLARHERDPLLFSPEDVIEKSHLSGEFFAAYLHQNYLEFFGDLDDVIRASDYFSASDHLTADWSSRPLLREYAASVAARGLIHCNSSRATCSSTTSGTSKFGWKPLHKPMCYSVGKKTRENCAAARALFRGHSWTPVDLLTQQLPYLKLINSRVSNPGQASLLQELTKYSTKHSTGNRAERLDEKAVEQADDEDERLASQYSQGSQATTNDQSKDESQSTSPSDPAGDPEPEDEPVIIEDFDD